MIRDYTTLTGREAADPLLMTLGERAPRADEQRQAVDPRAAFTAFETGNHAPRLEDGEEECDGISLMQPRSTTYLQRPTRQQMTEACMGALQRGVNPLIVQSRMTQTPQDLAFLLQAKPGDTEVINSIYKALGEMDDGSSSAPERVARDLALADMQSAIDRASQYPTTGAVVDACRAHHARFGSVVGTRWLIEKFGESNRVTSIPPHRRQAVIDACNKALAG